MDSGPLVGVFAAAVVLALVELVVALELANASSALFSAPTVIVLELPERAAAGDQALGAEDGEAESDVMDAGSGEPVERTSLK